MCTVSNDLMSYAASPSNPPKGYGSVAAGVMVLKYRGMRLDHYRGMGFAYDVAACMAEQDVLSKFGSPWVSTDEDGIPI